MLRDTAKQLAFKMIVFSRDKLTFSTKPHTSFLAGGVENLSIIAFFSRCDDGKAKKDKG